MSPQRATSTSFRPKEGESFDYKINVRLHAEEADEMRALAGKQPFATWIRSVLRRELRK
jgi:hypothetical protein